MAGRRSKKRNPRGPPVGKLISFNLLGDQRPPTSFTGRTPRFILIFVSTLGHLYFGERISRCWTWKTEDFADEIIYYKFVKYSLSICSSRVQASGLGPFTEDARQLFFL